MKGKRRILIVTLAILIAAAAAIAVSLTRDTKTLFAADGVNFLEDEAGAALYRNAGQVLNLTKAKTAFRTIEAETATYVIGSMALPSLPAPSEDVHCYVHVDGWIVVYYLKQEPLAKIVSSVYWSGGQLTSTKLDGGMQKICDALQVLNTNVKKYHFQYPNANNWEIVASTSPFNINVPGSFNVYERSFYRGTTSGCVSSIFSLDGSCISSTEDHGVLSLSQLMPDQFHAVGPCPSYCMPLVAICLVYQKP